MGVIILIICLIIEIGFAIYSLYSKSHQVKEKSIFRVGMFICFVILTILPVIEWSFRYYLLGLFLFLQFIFSLLSLVKGNKNTKSFNRLSIIFKTAGMVFLIFTIISPAILFPQSVEIINTTGKYQFLTKTFTYTDQTRIEMYTDTGENRKLNVQLWYPNTLEGEYPLIVFSHGGLGVKLSNESLYNELVSHGYIVCSIDHTYQCFYTVDENKKITLIDFGYAKELLTENAQLNIKQSYESYEKWMTLRMSDINFVIDFLITEAADKNSNSIYNLIDVKKIGVMGHSLGGSAALGIGRIRNDISAVAALESPFMFDIEGIEEGKFEFSDKEYLIPLLNVYSDSSWDILSDRPQYERNHLLLGNVKDTVHNVYISGVGHLGLTDLSITSPLLTHLLDRNKLTSDKAVHSLKTINEICLDFFNKYLKNREYFSSKWVY